MKIVSTSLLLIVTLIIVPIVSFYYGTPLGISEKMVLNQLVMQMVIIASLCFLVGELSKNNSQVDKIWSIVPILYTCTVAYYGDFSPRLILMSVLVTLWAVRLTYNFSRHGAYKWKFWTGKEDYRWEVLRQKPEFQPKWKWTLFNLFFISGYQNALILLFTLPTIVAFQNKDTALGVTDYIIAVLMISFIIYEFVADNQHWNYQTAKWKKIKHKEELTGDYKKGFLDKGLWALSRHPNYFAEQMIWICFYFFSVTASGEWINWSIAGSLLLVILFQGSSNFSEEISASKYSEYSNYQKRVRRFIPIKK